MFGFPWKALSPLLTTIIMTVLKNKSDVNLNFHSTNEFYGLTQRSVSQLQEGRFMAL